MTVPSRYNKTRKQEKNLNNSSKLQRKPSTKCKTKTHRWSTKSYSSLLTITARICRNSLKDWTTPQLQLIQKYNRLWNLKIKKNINSSAIYANNIQKLRKRPTARTAFSAWMKNAKIMPVLELGVNTQRNDLVPFLFTSYKIKLI